MYSQSYIIMMWCCQALIFLYNIVLEGCEGVAVSTAIYIDAPYGTRPSCGSGTNWPGMAR